MSKAKTRSRVFKERKVTSSTDSQDIMSCSLPKVMNENLKKQVENNEKGSPTNRSEFIRMSMKKFFDVMERIMEEYPDIFVNKKSSPNWAEPFSINFGAENINELNRFVKKCTAFYNRSEAMRMSIVVYHILEMIGSDLTTKKQPPIDTNEIQYVKINGKIRPILNLDYEAPPPEV